MNQVASEADVKKTLAVVVPTFLAPEMLHIYRQVTGLRRHRPVVFTQKRANADRFPFDPVVVLRRPQLREMRRFWARHLVHGPILAFRSEVKRLDEALRETGAEIVHFYLGQNGIYWLPWIEQRRLPAVVSFHGADGAVGMTSPAARRLLDRLFQAVDLVLVRSDELGEAVRSLGCPDDLVRVQRTGIPLEAFPFVERSLPPRQSATAPLLVQACRFIPKKGLDDSLRALARLQKKIPDIRLALAGGGPMEPALRALAAKLGVANAIEWHSFLHQDALRDLFTRAHVFIHPSKLTPEGDREGIPNAMLEAMATGLPVVATRHGGIPEAVRDGIDGLLVPEGDHSSLADALSRLLGDPALYRMLAQAARARATDAFSLDVQRSALEANYNSAVQQFTKRLNRAGESGR